jgi:hypothetical protein
MTVRKLFQSLASGGKFGLIAGLTTALGADLQTIVKKRMMVSFRDLPPQQLWQA